MKMIEAGSSTVDLPRTETALKMPGKIEYLFHGLICILMMGAFSPVLRNMLGAEAGSLEGDPFQRTILTAAYVLALLAFCFHLKEVLFMIARTPAIWLLLLWATLSVLWSGFPDVAFRRVLAIWLTSLYGLVLYLRFEFRQFLRLLGGALLFVMASSLVLLVVFPEWAVMGPPLLGKWRGAFIHKNHLGRFSALALLVAGSLFRVKQKIVEKVLWGLVIMVGLITLAGAQSLSALVIVAILIACALFFNQLFSRKKLKWLWLVLLVLISGLTAFLAVENKDRLLAEDYDKAASLSGRIPLWQNLAEKVYLKPLLGYGYGTFWLGTEGPAADIWKKLDWEVPHAHNGYLELWLQLGLPGIGLGLYLLLRLFTMSVKHLFASGPEGSFWVLFLVYFISYNMVESILFTANSLFWVMIVYGYVFLKNSCFSPAPDHGAEGAQPVGQGE
jgi:exopolysaccharide production protein ExoQ